MKTLYPEGYGPCEDRTELSIEIEQILDIFYYKYKGKYPIHEIFHCIFSAVSHIECAAILDEQQKIHKKVIMEIENKL